MVRGVQVWRFRPDHAITTYDPYIVYADYPNIFSMKVHHGGIFTSSPNRNYVNGKVQFVDFVDSECFTIEVVNNIVTMLKYDPQQLMFYHFREPKKNLDWGLRALGCDDDVVSLISYVSKYKVIEVFIEHNETRVESFYKPLFRKTMEIKEIDDTNEIVDLDEDDVVKKPVPRCSKQLAIEWLNSHVNEHENEQGNELGFDLGNEHEDSSEHENEQGNELGFDLGNEHEDSSEHGDSSEHEETEEVIEDEEHVVEETEEVIEDEEHVVEEVVVPMDGFRFNVDSDESGVNQALNAKVNLTEDDIEEFDFDSYESDLGDEPDNARKSVLRKLKKQGKQAAEQKRIVNYFFVGQEFASKEEAKKKIQAHTVETRRNIKLKKNDKVRMRAVCYGTVPGQQESIQSTKGHMLNSQKGKNLVKGINVIAQEDEVSTCSWSLYIHYEPDIQKWVVKTFIDEHKCLLSRKIKACNSSFLSGHVEDLIKLNPEMPTNAIQDQMQKQFHVGVSIHKAFRAKAKAESILKGDAEVQYGLLRDYVLELQKANPNTTVKLDVYREGDPESTTRKFRRIYVCLGALKDGFKAGERELLGLDGAFMRGQYPGQLLTAVAVDGNNGIYPVAYGIVESECLDSWLWFLSQLGDDLDLQRDSNFTFITDRQKGLLPAIKKLFPSAEHRFCVRHINDNLNLLWKGGRFKDVLWKAATATTKVEFTNVMNELKSHHAQAYEWLNKINPQHWSRSHFSGRAHCDLLINNICEVFNRQLLDARDSPIISALEYVRAYLMKRIVIVQKIIEKSQGPLTPAATKRFKLTKDASENYLVDWNGLDLYEVRGPKGDQCVVNLTNRTCSCRKWEVSGIPCRHAVACIYDMTDHEMDVGLPEDWVHSSYRLETWKKQYSFKINPVVGRHLWVKNDWPTRLLPPKVHVQIGRPPKKRKMSAGEVESMVQSGKMSRVGKQVTCKNCKGRGHNKRGCKQPQSSASQEASRKRKHMSATPQAASQPQSTQQQAATPVQASASQPQVQSKGSGQKMTKRLANKVLSPTKKV